MIQQVSSDYFGSEKNLIEALHYVERNSLYESAVYWNPYLFVGQ